jgi:hypothetical protein
MNIFSALFTGIAVWSNPTPAPVATDAQPVQVAVVQVAPNYDVTPLSEADVDLYLEVMRGAADHIAQATGDDRAALDFVRANHGNIPSAQDTQNAQETTMLLTRAMNLSNYDETIADRRGVKRRYDSIKEAVDGQVGMTAAGASCGGNCGNGTPTAAQIELGQKEDAAHRADEVVLTPHKTEILALQNQVHGFMYGR